MHYKLIKSLKKPKFILGIKLVNHRRYATNLIEYINIHLIANFNFYNILE